MTGNGHRTARCLCGSLAVAVSGPPRSVYTCSCEDCRLTTGSVLAFRAIFNTSTADVRGDRRSWRRLGRSGRWVEHVFCPACGALVFQRAEALPGAIAVSAGCFGDPAFSSPAKAYWSESIPAWLSLDRAVRLESG